MQVTVGAGIEIAKLVEALRPYNLTLQNYASISSQQVGGLMQVGGHGTGAKIPPFDENVLAFKIHTPSGSQWLYHPSFNSSPSSSPSQDEIDRFFLSRVAVGKAGVVSTVTIQLKKAHKLLEQTFVLNKQDLFNRHADLLKNHQHLRYMWIPFTDSVVVVACDPIDQTKASAPNFGGFQLHEETAKAIAAPFSLEERLAPARDFFRSLYPSVPQKDVELLSFTQLRDEIIAADPLNLEHIKKLNGIELEFWKRSQGVRVDDSDRVLSFDCGGQQLVNEIAFETGSLESNNLTDIKYVEKLMHMIEEKNVPAPSPIEQRWTARSASYLSPAYSPKPDALFSWVGIIMYLPTEDPQVRSSIVKQFYGYRDLCSSQLWKETQIKEHWAKIDVESAAARPDDRDAQALRVNPLFWTLPFASGSDAIHNLETYSSSSP